MYDIEQLNAFIVPELKEIAEHFSVKGFKRMAKMDLVHAILDAQADKEPAGGGAAEENPRHAKTPGAPKKEESIFQKADKKPLRKNERVHPKKTSKG